MSGGASRPLLSPSPYQPTRLVAGTRRGTPEPNLFGEAVEPEDRTSQSSPGRQIPVTDIMRENDRRDRVRREAASASAWTLRRELRAGNLQKPKEASAAPRR